jgi:hypothetical protein
MNKIAARRCSSRKTSELLEPDTIIRYDWAAREQDRGIHDPLVRRNGIGLGHVRPQRERPLDWVESVNEPATAKVSLVLNNPIAVPSLTGKEERDPQ